MTLQDGGTELGVESLTVGMANQSIATIGAYLVEAATLEPYPVSTDTISPTDYALTLKVSPL